MKNAGADVKRFFRTIPSAKMVDPRDADPEEKLKEWLAQRRRGAGNFNHRIDRKDRKNILGSMRSVAVSCHRQTRFQAGNNPKKFYPQITPITQIVFSISEYLRPSVS
jgi:hypothetical protein